MTTNSSNPSNPIDALALGTMTFGVETDEAGAFAQLDRFSEVGGTLIDTADVYGDGESERIIGRWLADRRPARGGDDGLRIATKGRFAPPDGMAGASRPALEAAVEASLERLGVDHIDLYLVHGWDQETPVTETLATLTGLVEAGTIGRIGWSNLTGYQFATIVTTARLADMAGPEVIQVQYNLLDRTVEHELLPYCLDTGITSQAWSPLGGGWLTGKYRRDARPDGATRLGEDPNRGVEAYDKRNTERTWAIIDAVTAIADDHGATPGQVAIAWAHDPDRHSPPCCSAPEPSSSWTTISVRSTFDSTTRRSPTSRPFRRPAFPTIPTPCWRSSPGWSTGSHWARRRDRQRA